MQSDKWGPHAWEFLHIVTFNYPEKPSTVDKQNHYDLFNNLRYTLPCSHCRESYSIFFKHLNIEPYLDSRQGLVFWLYVLHNMVNMKLEKPVVSLTEVVTKYESMRAQCGKVVSTEALEQCRANLPPVDQNKVNMFCGSCYEKYEDITLKNLVGLIRSGENPIKKI